MPRICLILIAGLDQSLLAKAKSQNLPLPTLNSLQHQTSYTPPLPAVTSTVQATLTTGVLPDQHGIICNGLYTFNNPDLQKHLDLSNHAAARTTVSFWEQSNSLLQTPRLWKSPQYPQLASKKTAMLFWQNSMPGGGGPFDSAAADIVLTPKPTHTPDGKTLTACWSNPATLYDDLVQLQGPFPLHNYWSPMAGLPSSQWIINASSYVWKTHAPDLQLVYIPHLDFNLQRLGPNHPQILKDLADIDSLLAPLAAQIRADGATLLIAGDYGMNEVATPILPNLALRNAGLLKTKPDAQGKLLIDYAASEAFVMADHQIAFVYTNPPTKIPPVGNTLSDKLQQVLSALPGVERILQTQDDLMSAGLFTSPPSRAGTAALLAAPNAWFAHDYWNDDSEKPQFQFTVDIHNKPGYDPRELFFDPVKKCIAQNLQLIKGSHALIDNPACHPVFLSETPLLPSDPAATDIAPALATVLAQ